MSREKPKIPAPPFWPIPALAQDWGIHESAALVLLQSYGLEFETRMVLGIELIGITNEEKEAFERIARPRAAPRYNPTERETHLLLIGALAVSYCGGDAAILDAPGRLISDLEQCAAANAVPVPRGYDTNTNALTEALTLLERHGYKRTRSEVPTAPQPADRAEARA